MTYKIYAPNEDYTGEVAGVSFVRGEATTESNAHLGWFRERGYEVEELAPEIVPPHISDFQGRENPEEPPGDSNTSEGENPSEEQGENPEENPEENQPELVNSQVEISTGEPSVVVAGDDQEEQTKNELKDELRKRGLPVSGSKDELIQRLQESSNE